MATYTVTWIDGSERTFWMPDSGGHVYEETPHGRQQVSNKLTARGNMMDLPSGEHLKPAVDRIIDAIQKQVRHEQNAARYLGID